ncbi:unnamed protein product [Adineta ricciae]|uniref:G-protein coupled receptors family 1 profile domain-containing protein n=1 Tax=Adineta ricciae TaxID=249248 RepID=A0A813RA41_ADIRI|nr:unnamed protein product [Adineta ricciae]CAF1036871.1 unnamed protein product [Adineta ricciae]
MSSLNSTLSSISPSTEIVRFQFILRLVVAVFGIPILLVGILGNTINILTFLKLGHYRRNVCSLYILSRSVFDLILLITGLGTRILSQSFEIDFTLTYRLWCKLRVPVIYINTLSSYTFLCLQSIDAFFVTSLSVSYRQKSNIQAGRYLLVSFVVIWTFEELVYVFYQDLIISSDGNSRMCVPINSTYAKYRIYVVYLFLTTIVPLALIIPFDILTYRHLRMHSLQRQRRLLSVLARQMTMMTLFHISAVFLFQAPFAAAQCYFLTFGLNKEPVRNAQEQIIQQFFNILGYGIYATSFYCYIFSSKRFREQVRSVFPCHQPAVNRIQPT